MAEERLYTEKEISMILKRAGERQTAQGQKESVGLSLNEIQQIAGEVGLDPALVEIVAAELDQNSTNEDSLSWLKTPNKLDVERVIQGVITEADWPETVTAIEKSLGVSGSSAQIGRMLEWTHTSKFAQYKVSLTPGEGQTKVRFFGNFNRLSRAWLIAVLGQVAVWSTLAGINLFSPAGGIPFGMAMIFLVYMIMRLGFVSYINKKERTFRQVITHLERVSTKQKLQPASQENDTDSQKRQLDLPNEIADQTAHAPTARKKVI